MQYMPTQIHNVPTNIISGFLGVGKTTAILDLFAKKPDTDKWAVLVNEFGKVGIDGCIYQSSNIAVKEIPGGCMCCAQGLPLQVAVNRLLRETRPDRLIIESSGVGHPAGVLKTLQGEGFNGVLTLKAGICLVDPEHLIDPDYQTNELFIEQIQYADVLVANKTDLASDAALQTFEKLADSFEPPKSHVSSTTHGQLNTDWLAYDHQPHSQEVSFKLVSSAQSKNWQTHTFHYPENTKFSIDALKRWLHTINITRLKGLIQTTDKCYLLNYSSGHVDITEIPHREATSKLNYIEVIDDHLNISELKNELNNCIKK
jgi:G3E family GTPase